MVYGDTDSLFIELKGRSLEEAHRIGKEMAATVSKSCPPDVVLKFEKVAGNWGGVREMSARGGARTPRCFVVWGLQPTLSARSTRGYL